MFAPYLYAVAALCAHAHGSSLRGAVEALQRRQRGPARADYDALYEFVPPQGYPEDYAVDIEDLDEEQNPKYVVKFLDDNDRLPESYEYKIIKKKNIIKESDNRKESAFRERSHHSDNDKLKDLFAGRNEEEEKNQVLQEKAENDADYALLLGQLWSKYRNTKAHAKNLETAPQGVVKLYKEKIVKKRYPDNWGPIAFKRKRSSDIDADRPIPSDYEERKSESPGPIYNDDGSDDDKEDWREEYAIAFQPLDDDSMTDLEDDDQYSYDTVEKRFPVTKRSSGSYEFNVQKKRFAPGKHDKAKSFRSSSGTDPRIIKDLAKIFGDPDLEIIKSPVKRSTDHENHEDHSHDGKPPKLSFASHNGTPERSNSSKHDDDSHEHHGHSLHHPGISGSEVEHTHDHHHEGTEKPIKIRKKSIDWSDYFGIDKRTKKRNAFISDVNQNRLRKQYADTFNKEVIYPLNSFRRHGFVKRNYMQAKPSEETIPTVQAVAVPNEDKRGDAKENSSKLDNIDQKLKTMEGMIVDEALHYSDTAEELDSKEEQEKKEMILSRLAAAYSLEKMRKALKEFKQSLHTQRNEKSDDLKSKRVSVKKETVEINNNEIPLLKELDKNDDFEEEQGAGHYINGKVEQQFSEGYMGGSGRHRTPVVATAGAAGSCPVLVRIVQRCRGVDMLAGDRGQLFLPLCSLHQICYLCGETAPTTCDLMFLSEADTSCEGDMGCQRAARSALMTLRELHDSQADELDGECEASPCLADTLKLNMGWQKALQR